MCIQSRTDGMWGMLFVNLVGGIYAFGNKHGESSTCGLKLHE